MITTLHINLPEYDIRDDIDYDEIGFRIDRLIVENMADGFYVERSIGLIEHPHKSLEELTEMIRRYGTDKYDKERTSIFDEEFSDYQFDIHGSEFEIRNQELVFEKGHHLHTYFGSNIYAFHKFAPIDRGYPVRIGISMIYDKALMLPAIRVNNKQGDITKYVKFLFRFKGANPLRALRAIVKIS